MVRFKKYIGTKSFYKQVALLAIPIVMQQFLSNAAQLVDSLMVGTLGSETIAGVAAANQIFFIVNSTLFGINTAGAIFVSQFLGSNNTEKIKETMRITYLISIAWMLIVTLLIQFTPHFALRFFISDEIALQAGAQYLKIVSLAYLPYSISIATAIGFRAIGKTLYPMYIGIVTLLVNTILNFILIFGHFGFPQLGLSGAAIATLIARLVELLFTLFIVLNVRPVIAVRPLSIFKFSKQLFSKVILKAIPVFGNEFFWAFGMVTLVALSAGRNADDLAAVSIASTINNLFYVLMAGLASAVSVIVGKSLGANRLKTAKHEANQLIFLATVIAVLASFILLILSFVAPGLYNVNESIQLNAQKMLQVTALFFPIYMINAGIFFVIRSGGDTLSAAIMDSGTMWLFQVPLAMLLVYFTDLSMIDRFFIVQATNILKLAVSFYLYRRGHWIKNLTT